MSYITTCVDVGEVDVDIDIDDIIDQLDDDDIKQIIEAKGYSVLNVFDMRDDIMRLSNSVILKMKSKNDYTQELETLLYKITGRYA